MKSGVSYCFPKHSNLLCPPRQRVDEEPVLFEFSFRILNSRCCLDATFQAGLVVGVFMKAGKPRSLDCANFVPASNWELRSPITVV